MKKHDNIINVRRSVFKNKYLSWGAKGIFFHMANKPEGTPFTVKDLVGKAKSKSAGVKSLLNELIEYDYVATVKDRGSNYFINCVLRKNVVANIREVRRKNLKNELFLSNDEINNKILLWRDVTPKYTDFFKRSVEREKISLLYEKFGDRAVDFVVRTLPKTNSLPQEGYNKFFWKIFSPYQLYQNWERYVTELRRYAESKNVTNKVKRI